MALSPSFLSSPFTSTVPLGDGFACDRHRREWTVALNAVIQRFMETMGIRLQKYRNRLGYTAKEVAQRISVPESTYRAWEVGRTIRGEPYMRLAEVLRVPVSELLTGAPAENTTMDSIIQQIEGVLADLRGLRTRA